MFVSSHAVARACVADLLVMTAVWAAPAHAQASSQPEDLSGFRAKQTELALIPRYCWGTFDEKFRGPGMTEFNLPAGCGERFNHFCPGLLSLARARAAFNNPQRRSYWLGVADGHIRYTVDGIKGLPACKMRPMVDATVFEIQTMKRAQR